MTIFDSQTGFLIFCVLEKTVVEEVFSHHHQHSDIHLLFIHSKIIYVITYDRILNFINQVVGVVLENYGGFKENMDETSDNKQGLSEVDQAQGHISSSPNAIETPSWRMVVNEKGQVNVPV